MMGGNTKFLFEGLMTRKGKKSTPTNHMESNEWNTPPGRFLNFLQDNNILDGLAYLTNTKRVSNYCLEGERGYIHYAKAGGQERYLSHLTAQLKASGIITPGNKS